MLNSTLHRKILSVLGTSVLTTRDVARKTRTTAATAAKYLHTLEALRAVQAVRIGSTVAWRAVERKPVIALMTKTTTARIIKLALGERYNYCMPTNLSGLREAFVLITDSAPQARSATIPVILIGDDSESAMCLPEHFDTRLVKVLVKKIYYEQLMPSTTARASITIEHLRECEEAIGIHRADELIKLTARLLKDCKLRVQHCERATFLITAQIPENCLHDIEHTFATILSHIYGRKVMPGEQIMIHDTLHTVPSLSFTVATTEHAQLSSVRTNA